MSDFSSLSLSDVRSRRRELQNEEDAVSFVRRLAQGRLDLVIDEERRRASGAPMPTQSLTERLAEVFGQQHGGGSARPPRETTVSPDYELLVQLDQLCDEFQFADVESLPDADLASLRDALKMFEQMCSGKRHEMFEQIDALTAELVKRLREGGGVSAVFDDK